jgi:hypothetical protein
MSTPATSATTGHWATTHLTSHTSHSPKQRPAAHAAISAALLVGTALLAACGGDSTSGPSGAAQPVVVTGAGDISGAVTQFRTLLGDPDNGGTPGQQPSGRRELTWDSVPDEFAAPFDLPPNFFNAPDAPRARGAVLSTPGTELQVSADSDNASGAAVRFGNINPSYSSRFRAFSAERLFSPIGSNIVDLTFYVVGITTPAVVRGFGAVYTGIDLADNTAFEHFDAAGRSLGVYAAQVSVDGLSFFGVVFPRAVISRVRIHYGTTALGPNDDATTDVAVMDNFLYSEPQAKR